MAEDALVQTQQAEPTPDFWCVVMLDDNRDVWVMRRSPDVLLRDVLDEFAGEDNGLDDAWAKDQPAGVYRLQLSPWAHQDSREGEWDTGVDVTGVEQLFALPPPCSVEET